MACRNLLLLIGIVGLCPNFGGVRMTLWAQCFLLELLFKHRPMVNPSVQYKPWSICCMLVCCLGMLVQRIIWPELNLLTIIFIKQALRWPQMKLCMDGSVFLHCNEKYLVSDCVTPGFKAKLNAHSMCA
jgi:hypothetical protein